MSDPPAPLRADVAAAPPPAPARGVARDLLRGSALYAIPNFGIKAISFLLLPLYTRFLTPDDYGIISLAETIAAVVGIVAGLGLSGAVTRLYFQYVDRGPELRRYVSSVLRFALAALAGVVALAFLAGPLLLSLAHFRVAFYPYLALAIGTAALLQFIDFRLVLFQVERRAARYAQFSFASFGLTTACAVGFVVVLRWGALGMLLGKAMAVGVTALAAAVLLWRWWRGGFAADYVRESLRLALPLVPHQLMAAGLVAADRLILAHYRDLTEVGIYSLAYAMGMVMYLVTASLFQAWSPIYFDVARGGDAARATLGRISSALCLLLIAVAALGSAIAQDFVAWFLDARYLAAGRLVPWIIAGYLFHSFFSLFHLAVLQGKRSEFLLAASSVSLLANLALNFALVPGWGMYGAAWATTAAYALEALLMFVYAQRIYRLHYRRLAILAGIAVLAAVVAATQLLSALPARGWLLAVTFVVAVALLALLGGRDVARTLTLLRQRFRPEPPPAG